MAKHEDGMKLAIGLMSGTSMDGIDVALIRTDGEGRAEPLAAMSFPYDHMMRRLLRRALMDATAITSREQRPGVLAEAERVVTEAHVAAVESFCQEQGLNDSNIGVIGFHGQTVLHRPEERLTVQIGDGSVLARSVGIPVVWDMRARDVAAGGHGAPLAPVYHRALALRAPEAPVAFLNIGGVSNVTWVGEGGRLLAFDAGPGNALMDDWTHLHTGQPFDAEGRLAAKGAPDEAALARYFDNHFFHARPPKSLDRGDFTLAPVEHLSVAAGAATLAALTARSAARAAEWFPRPARLWVVCGGGRRNRHLMELIAGEMEAPVVPAEALELDGDAMEAECWAYLAVRSLRGLPLTYPETTGAPRPLTGGVVSSPDGIPDA